MDAPPRKRHSNSWCVHCKSHVKGLCRHLRRHHRAAQPAPDTEFEVLPPLPPSPPRPVPRGDVALPLPLPPRESQLHTPPPADDRAPGTRVTWSPPEWWGRTDALQAANEKWATEPLCSVELPEEPSRMTSPQQAERRQQAERPQQTGRPVAEPDDVRITPTAAPRASRVRQLFAPQPLAKTTYVPSGSADVDRRPCGVTTQDLQFGNRVTTTAAGRLCDCGCCVQHALSIRERTTTSTPPTDETTGASRGLRFVRFPDCPTTRSSEHDRRTLSRSANPTSATPLVVCECVRCSLHRNLVKAWFQARSLPRH